jgi:cobalt-zinc-cadmium efflux system outer membrane protein
MRFFLSRALIAACCCLSPFAARADDAPLVLRAALQRALDVNPELRGFAFELRAQDARAAELALRPATTVDLLVEDAGGSGERRAFAAAQTTLSLSHLIELGGKRDGRIAVADASTSRLRTEQAARQLDVMAEVARRFVAALAQQSRVTAARDAVVLAERTQAVIEQRVQAAAAPLAEGARAQAATAEARLALDDAEHDLDTVRHALAAAIGTDSADFGVIAGDLFALDASLPFAQLVERLRGAPDFLRFADEARLRDAELRLAERQRRSDLRATVGVRRYEAENDVALVAGIAVPLFQGARAAPQIDLARAERARVDSDRDAAFLKAQHRLYAQYQELEHARHVSGVLRGTVLPRLEDAERQTAHAYRRGRYSYLEWADAQRRLLDTRLRLIDTAADFHDYRIDIERLTGESLAAAGDSP